MAIKSLSIRNFASKISSALFTWYENMQYLDVNEEVDSGCGKRMRLFSYAFFAAVNKSSMTLTALKLSCASE